MYGTCNYGQYLQGALTLCIILPQPGHGSPALTGIYCRNSYQVLLYLVALTASARDQDVNYRCSKL